MKKQELGLNKLSFSKSKIAELNKQSATGGTGTVSTAPQCRLTGVIDSCPVTDNCNTNGCNGGTGDCGSNDPTCNTEARLSCTFPC